MIEPWMVVAAGLAAVVVALVILAFRRVGASGADADVPDRADVLRRGETGRETTPPRPAAPIIDVMDEPVAEPPDASEPVLPTAGNDTPPPTRQEDHAFVPRIGHVSRAAVRAARMDSLEQQMKSRTDRRVDELDGLIAQAKRHVEDLHRQSSELAKTLQAARHESARRQAEDLERTPEPIVPRVPPRPTAPASPVAIERAAFARAAGDDTWPIPAPRPSTPAPPRPAAPDGAFVGTRHREVLQRLDQNQPVLDIARALGLDIGEIELIAHLNGRKVARGRA